MFRRSCIGYDTLTLVGRAIIVVNLLTRCSIIQTTLCVLRRRDIVVFSADLAAFTIPHGGSGKKKPAGPDMLLSYHDNDHYNSIRDNSVNKPPIIQKKDEAYGMVDDNESNETVDDSTNQSSTADKASNAYSNAIKPRKRPVKKSAPCPCGSGLRYKKCCWNKEKHGKKNGDVVDPPSDKEEAEILNGGFRVLAI